MLLAIVGLGVVGAVGSADKKKQRAEVATTTEAIDVSARAVAPAHRLTRPACGSRAVGVERFTRGACPRRPARRCGGTPQETDLVATAKRRGGIAAKLAAQIASLQRQLRASHGRISELCDRSGPEYLVEDDISLASWLVGVAADHPGLFAGE